MTTHDPELVEMADGRTVPKSLVDALDLLNQTWPGATLRQARPAIARAVLDAITTSPRYVLVELPEPEPGWCYVYPEDGDAPDHLLFGEIDEFVVTRWGPGSGVQVSHQGEPLEPLSPYEARSFAAALLAAARHAESTATETKEAP